MERIQKLPIILGCSAAIVAGFAAYLAGVDSQGIYIRMAGMMLVFFIIGVYIRKTVTSINEEVQIRKIREQQEEKERQKRKKEEEKAAAANVPGIYQGRQPLEHERQFDGQTQQADLKTEISEDSFEPMTVSRAIRTKMNG
jgi:hypothetical protein